MGTRGERRTETARAATEEAVKALAPLGDVSSRGMFGGFGIFKGGVMFALVNSAGTLHLRVGPATRSRYEACGAVAHGRMPYFEVPDAVREEPEQLLVWAREAAEVAAAERS